MTSQEGPDDRVTSALLDLHDCCPGDPLRIGGIDAEELARRHGTPCYVYDAQLLRSRYEEVNQSLGVEILYALKANPSLAVASVLRQAGAGAEVASGGEILIAEKAGFAASSIQFAGPGKSPSDLTLALDKGIHCINIESRSEYDSLASLARQRKQRPGVAIRVNPREGLGGSRMRMSGGATKFGVDEDQVADLIQELHKQGIVELHGLHCYMGTQCFDAKAWLDSASHLMDFAKEMEAKTGVPLPSLDFGGGFAVPAYSLDPEFDLALAGQGMRSLLQGEDRRAFVELGRYLVAPSGVFLTRVLHIKKSQGKRYAILDGGMHQHAAAAGVGSVLRRPYPIVAAKDPHSQGTHSRLPHSQLPHSQLTVPQTLCGPLCTPADDFVSDLALPELGQGDLLAILVSGAYGPTFSSLEFLSHPAPAEVLVDKGSSWTVREPGRIEDTLARQSLPPQ
jgi:diaminopimelate decarboxylase